MLTCWPSNPLLPLPALPACNLSLANFGPISRPSVKPAAGNAASPPACKLRWAPSSEAAVEAKHEAIEVACTCGADLLDPTWLQNKIDLISEAAAEAQHEAIETFIQSTIAEGAPVVPISAQLKYNVDAVCEYICKKVPIPVRWAAGCLQLTHAKGRPVTVCAARCQLVLS